MNSTEPTNEYTKEFLKERRKGSLRADEDYFVPNAALTELKESLLSKQSMFFNEMRMMMLAQRESIFELKVYTYNCRMSMFNFLE